MAGRRRNRYQIILFSLLLLAGCATQDSIAPVNEVTFGGPRSTEHVVMVGETLYSIAWEAGIDYRQLAKINDIGPPYTIYPGQKIRLKKTGWFTKKDEYYIVRKGDTLYSIATDKQVAYRDLANWNNISPPYTIHVDQRLKLSGRPAYQPTSVASGNTPVKKEADSDSRPRHINWVWPANGDVVRQFNKSDASKGIDVVSSLGDKIAAAAPGKIVYQGTGLAGYGQLIIIKHNDDYLSAYAHCHRVFVKEGAVVKGGQKIAEMGKTGADRVKLHFEIRYRGNPVNPLRYLPKR